MYTTHVCGGTWRLRHSRFWNEREYVCMCVNNLSRASVSELVRLLLFRQPVTDHLTATVLYVTAAVQRGSVFGDERFNE